MNNKKLGEVTKETRTLRTHLNGYFPTETSEMKYRSDYLGRMQWIEYPDGELITYGYDNGGQVISVTGEHWNKNFEYVTNILYDQYGQRTRIDYGNGTFTEYNYDPERRWLDTIKTCKGDATGNPLKIYQNIKYNFDAVGNVTSYENNCMDNVRGNYKTTQSYTYDSLYQLTGVKGSSSYTPDHSVVYKSTYSQVFDFDGYGLGNMVTKTSKEDITPWHRIGDDLNYELDYEYDYDNYSHRRIRAGNRYYKYDANGNIICEQDGSFESNGDDTSYHKINREADTVYSTDYGWGLFRDDSQDVNKLHSRYKRTYSWNERNQLVLSVDANYTTSYIYSQDGERTNKYTSSSETLYFNKMWSLHTDAGNSIHGGQYAKNVYLGETRIVTKLCLRNDPRADAEELQQYFYHSDHLGSASLISDYKGDEYQRIEYTPYGETWIERTDNKGLEYLPYKFTAKELDPETGLYYFGARYLDSKYSTWISTDPALSDYIPQAPINDEAKRHNQNLPGMGGIFNHINANLYAYAANNPVRYIDPDGETIFLIGWASNAGCGTGVANNTGIYLLTDWKGNVSIGFYSTESAGAFFGVGASTGVEITIAPFADEFADIEGYSLSAGGSGSVFGPFSVGGEVGFNPNAKTSKDKLQSLTVSFSGTFSKPGLGSPGEGHIYNNYTFKLSEWKISDSKKVEEIQKNLKFYYDKNDYDGLKNYLATLSKELIDG